MYFKYLRKFGTKYTRGQFFWALVGVMFLVVGIIAIISFPAVFHENRSNINSLINGNMESISNSTIQNLEDIDKSFQQLILDPDIQEIINFIVDHKVIPKHKAFNLKYTFNKYMVFNSLIDEMSLYDKNGIAISPLEMPPIVEILPKNKIYGAWENPSKTIWINKLLNSDSLYALRSVRSVSTWEKTGYILFKINPNKLLFHSSNYGNFNYETILLDSNQNLVASTTDKIDYRVHEEEDNIIFKNRLAPTGWTVSISVNKQLIYSSYYALQKILIIALVIGGFVALFCSIFLSQLITHPIQDIQKVMNEVYKGNYIPNKSHYYNFEINELNNTYNELINKIIYLIHEVYEKQQLSYKSEIRALQAQINPHFLYNTLEAINWLIRSGGEEKATNAVLKLSKLFQYRIGSSNFGGGVNISDELEHINQYLDIMKIRFDERLNIEINCTPSASKILIPRLSLQPLVENAISHGIEDIQEGGNISISIEFVDSYLQITISDNGIGIEETKLIELNRCLIENSDECIKSDSQSSNGVGLLNVNKRLKLFFKNNSEMRLLNNTPRGTIVKIIIKDIQRIIEKKDE